MEINIIFSLIILLMSIATHEASHGYVADQLGDPTARQAGRLTLNPLKHLDFFGSILFPLMTFFIGGFIFGWAKPVPYNPYNLKDQRWGEAKVAFAGPASNFALAIFFGLILRFISLPPNLITPISLIVLINLVLAIFNLIPVPPLDGSKILYSLIPYKYHQTYEVISRFSIILLVVIILFLWQVLFPIVTFLFRLLTGFSL